MATDEVVEWRPPGTVNIEDCPYKLSILGTYFNTALVEHDKLIFQPRPSDDPEQPLNWSPLRKTVNFSIVCFYALMTFVL
jgi:hypothetical protein